MIRRMTQRHVRGYGLLALAATLLAVAACQFVAGVQSRSLDPQVGGCALPGGSGPQVRIANFAPTADIVDVCIRAAGGTWGEPLILNGGTDCTGASYFNTKGAAAGFAYGQTSVPFTAPASKVDVKMIAAGGTCSSTALTEADGLSLDAKAVTTLLRIGGAKGVAQKIEALPENTTQNNDNTLLRFVHAMPGIAPVDVGTAPAPPAGATAHLPTTLDSPILTVPLSYGTVPKAGALSLTGTVLPGGYAPLIAGTYPIVAAVHGQTPPRALLLLNMPRLNGAYVSLYMTGAQGSGQFPVRGFLCPENNTDVGAGQATNKLLVPCLATGLSEISIDVFNTSLYGADAPAFSDRQAAIDVNDPTVNPVALRDTDIQCLVELDYLSDIQKIQSVTAGAGDAGTGPFPYSYYVKTGVTTPPTDAHTLDGSVPPPVTTPPCGGSVSATSVQNAYTCMQQNCNTRPGDPTGQLPGSTDCLTTNCEGPLGGLLITAPACFDCILDYAVSYQPYQDGQNACTNLAQQPFGFQGLVSQMILSRYPLLNSDVFILPSTNYRQAVLYSQVQLEDQTVDFYCGFLTSTLVAGSVPYEGFYGAGGNPTSTDTNGAYANEQLLQAKDLIAWVTKKSGNNPAIIVGDWRSSVGVGGDGGAPPPDSGLFSPPVDLVPLTVQTMTNAPDWLAVQGTSWTPQCTYCPSSENPLNAGVSQGFFMTQPFLYKWPTTAGQVTDESLVYTDNSVSSAGNNVPLSQYYGLNFHVQRPK